MLEVSVVAGDLGPVVVLTGEADRSSVTQLNEDEAVQGGEGEDAADLGAGDRQPDLPAFGPGSLVRADQGVQPG